MLRNCLKLRRQNRPSRDDLRKDPLTPTLPSTPTIALLDELMLGDVVIVGPAVV